MKYQLDAMSLAPLRVPANNECKRSTSLSLGNHKNVQFMSAAFLLISVMRSHNSFAFCSRRSSAAFSFAFFLDRVTYAMAMETMELARVSASLLRMKFHEWFVCSFHLHIVDLSSNLLLPAAISFALEASETMKLSASQIFSNLLYTLSLLCVAKFIAFIKESFTRPTKQGREKANKYLSSWRMSTLQLGFRSAEV